MSAGFLMLFPLMSELSVLRILIIMKRAQPDKLPLPMLVGLFEEIDLNLRGFLEDLG